MVLQMNLDFFERTIVFGAPSTQWWTQLATAIAGGLAFATVLTLVLTPCLLVLRDKRKEDKQAIATISLQKEAVQAKQIKEVSNAA